MIAPFVRELKKGANGRDVGAVKRALNVWRPGTINNTTRVYAAGMVKAVETFQKAEGLAADGIYGKTTHAKLAPFFDPYGVWLLTHTPVATPRSRVVAAAVAIYNYHRATGLMHYTQGDGRMSIVVHRLHPPFTGHVLYEDCSSFATGCYFIAGQNDPNGRGYDGFGFTGTLAPNGVGVERVYPADLVFYGSPPNFEHVVVAVGDDASKPTDRCISHGHEGAPELLPITYRTPTAIRSYLPR